jgi:hypothetical protein
MGIMPSGARTSVRPIRLVARHIYSPWSDSNGPSSFDGRSDLLGFGLMVDGGVPKPYRAELCRAAAGPNPRHDLALGLPASLR